MELNVDEASDFQEKLPFGETAPMRRRRPVVDELELQVLGCCCRDELQEQAEQPK
jgi:hypothetical protein